MMDAAAICMTCLLAAIGYGLLAYYVCRPTGNSRIRWLAALVLLVIYLCVCCFAGVVFSALRSEPVLFFSLLLCAEIPSAAFVIRRCAGSTGRMRTGSAALLGAYILLLLYATLLSRIGTVSSSVCMQPFMRVSQAAKTGNLSLMQHDFMNLLMFLPLGMLFSLMFKPFFGKLGIAVIIGLVLSTAIEATQLMAHLGVCDINDVIANTAGSAAGCILCSALQKNSLLIGFT